MSPVNQQTGAAYSVQKAPGGSWHIYKDGRKVFVAATAPKPAAAAPAAPAAAPAPLNYDANYYQQEALQQKQRDISKQGVAYDRTNDQTNTAEAIRRLQAQRPQDEQNAKVGANKSGLFYSGTLGKNLQNIATSYIQRQGDMQSAQAQREQQRLLQEQQIDAGGNIDTFNNQQASLAAQIQQRADAAAGNYLVTNPVSAPASTAVTPTKSAYQTVTKGGYVWHYYPDGRKVKVRKA